MNSKEKALSRKLREIDNHLSKYADMCVRSNQQTIDNKTADLIISNYIIGIKILIKTSNLEGIMWFLDEFNDFLLEHGIVKLKGDKNHYHFSDAARNELKHNESFLDIKNDKDVNRYGFRALSYFIDKILETI